MWKLRITEALSFAHQIEYYVCIPGHKPYHALTLSLYLGKNAEEVGDVKSEMRYRITHANLKNFHDVFTVPEKQLEIAKGWQGIWFDVHAQINHYRKHGFLRDTNERYILDN